MDERGRALSANSEQLADASDVDVLALQGTGLLAAKLAADLAQVIEREANHLVN